MKRFFFGWLVRELQQINYKLVRIISDLEDLKTISEQTARLKTATDALAEAVKQRKKV